MKKNSDQKLKVSASAVKALESLSKSNNKLLTAQDGIPDIMLNAGSKTERLGKNLNSVIARAYNNFVGLGQDVNAHEVNQLLALSKRKGDKRSTNVKKQLEDFKKSVGTNDQAAMLVQQRKTYKASLYSSYDLILNIIPKMKLAVNTIANSIISPDDFSKHSFASMFNETRMSKENIDVTKERVKDLLKKHKIEDELKADVVDALVKGEKFFAVLSMNDEIKSLLKENADTEKDGGYETLKGSCGSMLNEAAMHRDEGYMVEEGLALFSESKDEKDQTKVAEKRKKFVDDLDEFLHENLIIGDSKNFLAEHLEQETELNESAIFQRYSQNANDTPEKTDTTSGLDGLRLSTDSAVLKRLDADNVVKLEYDGRTYGYIYLDVVKSDKNDKTTKPGAASSSGGMMAGNSNSVTSSIQGVLYSANDVDRGINNTGQKSGQVLNDPKLAFIADAFVNRLSQKENIRLIRKNEQLKYMIYHSLITKRITKDEKMRIIFFSANEVVHIDRKESIFDNILFFAKMYIATLITILMQNIVRGADKRAYYIDIGLENDAANAVNDVIRSVKAKDIANLHNMDIGSVLNVLGEFNDYYMPTIDGEKPITMETIEGLSNVSLDNDFLNWLSNNIFSGIGLPSAYLTEVENVDFAKTLGMQSARFIRDIIAEQIIFGKGYSELLQKLYLIEHGDPRKKAAAAKSDGSTPEDGKKSKEKDDDVLLDIESLCVKFPSPVSLNMTNLNDQLNNLNMLVETLGDIIDVPEADKAIGQTAFKREMYKKFLSNLDWEAVEEIMKKVQQEVIKSKLNPANAPADAAPPAGADDGSEDDAP
jgi:hypothetical protein